MEKQCRQHRYVLVTPARNEADYIESTLKSVVAQTIAPSKWVIVSDGSTDGTDGIVERYAKKHAYIEFVARVAGTGRDFGSKVFAFNAGFERLGGTDYSYIGNLDADISLDPDYFERLLQRFSERPRLGIGGGAIFESVGGEYRARCGNRIRSVAGAVQLFRKECFQEIGGYSPIETGGIDTLAEVTAAMLEWEVESFPDLMVRHHRTTSTALGSGSISVNLRAGRRDYALGNHPLYQLCKSFGRLSHRPIIIASYFQLVGYFWAALGNDRVAVPDDVYRYLRKEQLARLREVPMRLRGSRRDS